MCTLLVILLLPIATFGIDSELKIETGLGNIVVLSAFRCHEEFYTALSDHIGIKVRNASQAILVPSKEDVAVLLSEIDYLEYTFLQIFHSLGTGEVSFTKQLIELYYTFGRELRLSDYFKSHVVLHTKPTYEALSTIANSIRNGLNPFPAEISSGILAVANKSCVFEEASRRANAGLIKSLQQHVSEAERRSALEAAWRQQRLDIVKLLIKANMTFVEPGMKAISHRNSKGESVLHLAAELKNPLFVKSLLESGAQVNITDESGATPLYIAVKSNDISTANILIEKQADVNAETKSGEIPLHEASRNGNSKMVTLLLASGSSAGKETDQGVTPLLISEKYVFRETVEYLFWSNSTTVKKLPYDLKFLYFMTSYEGTSRITRRRKINLDQILEHSIIVKELFLRGEKTYIPSHMKSTLLNLVLKSRSTSLARSLLNIGAKMDPKQAEIKLIFRNAIENDDHEITDLMLHEGMSENTEVNGISALKLAADKGSVATFNLLITRGADVKKLDKNYESLLHVASGGGKESIVRYLLQNGYSVDSFTKGNTTPLFYAAIYGFPEIVKLLIDHKANPKARNTEMDTPMHYAAYSENTKSFNILFERGADIEARNKDGETPLFSAARIGNEDSVLTLISLGADIDAKDNANRTPLEISIVNGNRNITRILIENGSNPNRFDAHSKSCLHLAVSTGKLEMVELLLEKGVHINPPDGDGRNALHLAVSKKFLNIVERLVSSGISVNAKDKDGRTPLDYAIANCYRSIVSFLAKKGAKASILAEPQCIFGY